MAGFCCRKFYLDLQNIPNGWRKSLEVLPQVEVTFGRHHNGRREFTYFHRSCILAGFCWSCSIRVEYRLWNYSHMLKITFGRPRNGQIESHWSHISCILAEFCCRKLCLDLWNIQRVEDGLWKYSHGLKITFVRHHNSRKVSNCLIEAVSWHDFVAWSFM